MAHALSAFAVRSDRTPLQAFALAALLHVLLGLALWWMWLNETPFPEPPIEITFEQIKPAEPPPPPPPPPPERAVQPPPPPSPPLEGLRPPAPITADKPTQVPPSGDRPKEPPAPPPPPLQEALPTPAPLPPSLEQAPPPPQPLQPTPAPQEQALAVPQPAKPQPPAAPLPQPRPPEQRPSPLTTAPPQRAPGGKPTEDGSPSPLVNPADVYNRARVQDNYLWQVVRKLQGYRYEAKVNASQGLTVVRVVIARDGRLLNASIARSSGYPEFDNGVMAGVRSGSPYAPLPSDIKGASATFDLPLVSINRR